jgi:hypothetical protein
MIAAAAVHGLRRCAGEDLAGSDRVHFVDQRRRNPVPDAVCKEFRAFS